MYNNKILRVISKISSTGKIASSSSNHIHTAGTTIKNPLPIYLDKTNLNEPFTDLNTNLLTQTPLTPTYDTSHTTNKNPKIHLMRIKNKTQTPLNNSNLPLNLSLGCFNKFMPNKLSSSLQKQYPTLPIFKYVPYVNSMAVRTTYNIQSLEKPKTPTKTIKYAPYKPNNIQKLNYLSIKFHAEGSLSQVVNTEGELFKPYQKSNINSRVNNNFTLINIGIFVLKNLTNLISVNSTKYKYIYKIKKSLYSFTKPNQIKNIVLKRKASLIFYKLIFLSKNKTHQLRTLTNLTKNSIVSNYFTKKPLIQKNNLFTPIKVSTVMSSYDNNQEIRLARVRFRPGYQRLWRDSRTALKDLIGLKFIYQKQLTKYIVRFYKKTYQPTLLPNELHLSKLAVYSRIAPDYNTFTLFYNTNLFFINGSLPTNKNVICVLNDFIQLIVSKWYYIFFRWLSHWTLVRFRKIKRLIYRKGLSSRYKVMKSRKQKSNTVPDWIFLTKHDFSDVKPFIEVDYFTLSFSLVYEPYYSYYHAPTNLLSPKTNIYRLYNWKYIT